MKYYGIESEGYIKIESLSALPAHSGADDVRRLVYITGDDKIYFGRTASWLDLTATSSPSSSATGIDVIDIRAENMSLDDTNTDVSYGTAFSMIETVDFEPTGDGSCWISCKFPDNFSPSQNLELDLAYNLNGADDSKNIRLVVDFWALLEAATPDHTTPDVSYNNDIASANATNINKFDEIALIDIDSSNIPDNTKSIVIKLTRDISEDTYTGTLQITGIRIHQ